MVESKPLPGTVASFGASTAQGTGDTEAKGFINRLASKLGGEALNFGVGGETTLRMLDRLPSLSVPTDALIIVTLGINDVPRTDGSLPEKRVPLDEHRVNVERLLAHLSQLAGVLYLSQFRVDGERATVDEAEVETYIDAGMDVARKSGIAHIDLRQQIPPEDDYARYLADDGLHFNPVGHELIANALNTFIHRQ